MADGQLTGDNTNTALLATSKIGKRVEIDGRDNSLKFYSGSDGVKVISLSDQESIYSMVPNFITDYTSSALLAQKGASFEQDATILPR